MEWRLRRLIPRRGLTLTYKPVQPSASIPLAPLLASLLLFPQVPYLPSSDDFDDDATNNREDDQPDCYLDSAHHIALASRLHSQSHRLQRQYDKEWAALTTWLRLNLHQPRTPKRMILFIGRQDDAAGVWSFDLNPGLTWDDVSNETKLRLKTLPDEVVRAGC